MTWPWSGPDPAGCTAALYAARAGLDVLVLERLGPGGQMAQTQHIENYPGFVDGIDGAALAADMKAGAEHAGAVFLLTEVRGARLTGSRKELQTDGGPVLARTVVLATGAGPRRLGLPQEDELPGVSYCAACDGAFFRGKDVAVVGGGNSAVSEALLLSRLCRHVTLVHRRSTFRAAPAGLAALEKQSNVTFCRNSIVTELLGRERLTGIRLQNGRELEISGLFVCIGRTPVSALGGEQLRRTPDGYYCADETTRDRPAGRFCRRRRAGKAAAPDRYGRLGRRSGGAAGGALSGQNVPQGGNIARIRAAAAADECSSGIDQRAHMLRECLRAHGIDGLALRRDLRHTRIRLDKERHLRGLLHIAHKTFELVRAGGAVDADGGRAELLQRLHGLDTGPAEIAAAVGLHRHAAQDRQGADALRRLEGDGHLVDAEHGLHNEQGRPRPRPMP